MSENRVINDAMIISTRIRLARNLRTIPFVSRLSLAQKNELCRTVYDVLKSVSLGEGYELACIDMSALTKTAAFSFAERHLISPQFAADREGKAMILSKNSLISIMIGEEDHIRIQVLMNGSRLKEALDIANRIDDILDEHLEYAFSEEIGYLTECPSNLGTGLRASLMLHLPMIERSKSIGAISATLSKIGLTIRGTYGEGSEVVGSFYQLSNQVTLGISEDSAIDNLSAIADQIIAQELGLRDVFNRTALEDKAYRALGVLTHARILSSSELTEAASALLLGISAGILPDFSAESVRVLLGLIGPATIMSMVKKDLSPAERDVVRADLAREFLTRAVNN